MSKTAVFLCGNELETPLWSNPFKVHGTKGAAAAAAQGSNGESAGHGGAGLELP